MPVRDELIAALSAWAEKADHDLQNAAHTLRLGKRCPTDTVAFHVQQCVEKYLKAVLVLHGVEFPKTHDIANLVARLPSRLRVPLTPAEADRLTDYATVTRYPGEYEPVSLQEARQAVRLAREVRRSVRALLPRTALRRRRRPGT